MYPQRTSWSDGPLFSSDIILTPTRKKKPNGGCTELRVVGYSPRIRSEADLSATNRRAVPWSVSSMYFRRRSLGSWVQETSPASSSRSMRRRAVVTGLFEARQRLVTETRRLDSLARKSSESMLHEASGSRMPVRAFIRQSSISSTSCNSRNSLEVSRLGARRAGGRLVRSIRRSIGSSGGCSPALTCPRSEKCLFCASSTARSKVRRATGLGRKSAISPRAACA